MVAQRIGLTLLMLLMVGSSLAGEDPLAHARALVEDVRRVEASYRGLGAFRLTVEERYLSVNFGGQQAQKAVLHVVPPEKLLYEYQQPAGDWAVFDGQAWWLASLQDREIIRRERREGDLQPLIDLVSGRLDLLKVFAVQRSLDLPAEDNLSRLEMVPREVRDDIDRVVLEFETKSAVLRRVEVYDPLGGRTLWILSAPVKEEPVPESRFKVEIPEGFFFVEE